MCDLIYKRNAIQNHSLDQEKDLFVLIDSAAALEIIFSVDVLEKKKSGLIDSSTESGEALGQYIYIYISFDPTTEIDFIFLTEINCSYFPTKDMQTHTFDQRFMDDGDCGV